MAIPSTGIAIFIGLLLIRGVQYSANPSHHETVVVGVDEVDAAAVGAAAAALRELLLMPASISPES